MAYTSWSVVFGEQPSAAKWNILGTNDAAFNDGSGFSWATTTYTNPGTAGGTNSFFYYNIGGIKHFWGITANQTSNNAAPTYGITLPSSYFTTVKDVQATAINMTGDTRQYIAVSSFTASVVNMSFNAPNGAATTGASVHVTGT